MKSINELIDKYASIGVNKDEVLDQYARLKTEIFLKEGLHGSLLETKVYKIMEDKFLELLEKVVENED